MVSKLPKQQSIVAPVDQKDEMERAWRGVGLERPPEDEVRDDELTPFPTVKEMRERLKELCYAVHGNKQTVFERLRKAERGEKTRRDKQKAILVTFAGSREREANNEELN